MDIFGTIKEYSELTGITRQAIEKNIKAGKILKTGTRINFDQADNIFILSGRLHKKTLPGEEPVVIPKPPIEHPDQIPVVLEPEKQVATIPGISPDVSEATKKLLALTVERTRKTKAEANIKELEHEELSGDLVRLSDISNEIFKMNRKTRDRILAVPNRIPGLTHEQREEMKVELRTALEELSSE